MLNKNTTSPTKDEHFPPKYPSSIPLKVALRQTYENRIWKTFAKIPKGRICPGYFQG